MVVASARAEGPTGTEARGRPFGSLRQNSQISCALGDLAKIQNCRAPNSCKAPPRPALVVRICLGFIATNAQRDPNGQKSANLNSLPNFFFSFAKLDIAIFEAPPMSDFQAIS